MAKFNEFSENDNGTITAYPQNQTDEPVRFDASIADRKENEEEIGNWERLVKELMDYELGEALDITDDGEAVITRQQAREALVESDDEFASTEWQAEAVLEYLADSDIIEIDDQQVTLLKDFEQIKSTDYNRMFNNWAAMFDACIERIDVARSRVEEAKKRFEHREQETVDAGAAVNSAERMDEIEQEIRRIVGDRSPRELDEEERNRVENLRKQYHFHESMEDAGGLDVTNVADNAEELGLVMERFEAMREIMRKRREDFRELALGEAIFPEDLVELSEQYASFLSEMSNTMAPAEKMENEDLGSFLDNIGAGSGQIEETAQQAQQLDEQELKASPN